MGEISENEVQTLAAIRSRLNPRVGLPGPVFDFAYAVIPMVNVDLLAVSERGFLLAWREDEIAKGWHVPGGIFRRGETFADRIKATAGDELGANVDAWPSPAAILEIFGARGHNISFLYPCRLVSPPTKPLITEAVAPRPGDLCWFSSLPADTYPGHEIYAETILEVASGRNPGPPAMLRWPAAKHRGG